jgi:hypothetical protein
MLSPTPTQAYGITPTPPSMMISTRVKPEQQQRAALLFRPRRTPDRELAQNFFAALCFNVVRIQFRDEQS